MPGKNFIGVENAPGFSIVNKPVHFTLNSFDYQENKLRNKPFEITVFDNNNTKVIKQNLVTNFDGKANYSFTPSSDGVFKLLFKVKDKNNNITVSEHQFPVISKSLQVNDIDNILPKQYHYDFNSHAEFSIPK